MPEINQYTVNAKELVTLILKEADIHEGRWWLLVNFGLSPGNFGPNPAELVPGIVVAVQHFGIQREMPGQPPPDSLVVDAAIANPRRSENSARARGKTT
jgi:hypothetical protein